MKYTSILASALGLMALAACTNNDEVAMEQPQLAEAPTLKVTIGTGADTRMALSEYNATEGIKASWEVGDEIYVASEGDDNPSYIYKAVEAGNSAVFKIESYDVPPSNNIDYYVGYPKTLWAEGFDFSTQDGDLEGLAKLAYASGTVKFQDKKVSGEVTLKPLASILVIPAGTEMADLFSADFNPENVKIIFSGTNLITNWNVAVDGVDGSITINANNMFIVDETEKTVKADSNIYIAIPVDFEGKSVTKLEFTILSGDLHVNYNITTTGDPGSTEYVTISEGGKVYNLSGHMSCTGAVV